jgi:hypothetical protein
VTKELSHQQISELLAIINFALRQWEHRNADELKGDSIHDSVCKLNFPVNVSIITGTGVGAKGFHTHHGTLGVPLRDTMQNSVAVTAIAGAVVGYAWAKKIRVGVLVHECNSRIGVQFVAGEEPDDVLIFPAMRAPQ